MATLESRFQKWAQRVRSRATLRSALTGLGVGAAFGAVGALVAHFLRFGEARPLIAAGLAGLGLVAGLVHAHRRRWSDGEVALYLDARWDSSETITTALELGRREVTPAGLEVALTRAAELLDRGDRARAEPKLWTKAQLLIPVAALAAAAISDARRFPRRPPAPPRAPRQ